MEDFNPDAWPLAHAQEMWDALALSQTADRHPANKPVEPDEPGRLSALTHRDPEQDILPGLPVGFLAYQINARSRTVGGGGWAGPGDKTGP